MHERQTFAGVIQILCTDCIVWVVEMCKRSGVSCKRVQFFKCFHQCGSSKSIHTGAGAARADAGTDDGVSPMQSEETPTAIEATATATTPATASTTTTDSAIVATPTTTAEKEEAMALANEDPIAEFSDSDADNEEEQDDRDEQCITLRHCVCAVGSHNSHGGERELTSLHIARRNPPPSLSTAGPEVLGDIVLVRCTSSAHKTE